MCVCVHVHTRVFKYVHPNVLPISRAFHMRPLLCRLHISGLEQASALQSKPQRTDDHCNQSLNTKNSGTQKCSGGTVSQGTAEGWGGEERNHRLQVFVQRERNYICSLPRVTIIPPLSPRVLGNAVTWTPPGPLTITKHFLMLRTVHLGACSTRH